MTIKVGSTHAGFACWVFAQLSVGVFSTLGRTHADIMYGMMLIIHTSSTQTCDVCCQAPINDSSVCHS